MAHWLRAHAVLLENVAHFPASMSGSSQSPIFPGDPNHTYTHLYTPTQIHTNTHN